MVEEKREKNSEYYKIMDSLMLSNYEDCVIKDGKYLFTNSGMTVDIGMTSFYLNMDPKKYIDPLKFRKTASWNNDLIKCGVKLTGSTGLTYSYPKLRDQIGTSTKNDHILRASYFFACVTQVVTFFSQRIGDLDFKKNIV